ncbi:heavy metal-associated isoprenylated plant protein 3 [Tripterygium wilfordii]|uniref:heavy metal-associated isoprenylated plant protein 3 n=1 Tax=Tripterygium wilfordii TaxID=458696 RepID=UPI0018F85BF8|nr:heavy metal-associated isoprenylated plant protein 3 [Tripterygium wilfordii]
MGKNKKNNENNDSKADEETKRGNGDKNPITVVLKVDMHCDGCAVKITKCARGFEGVETVKAEADSNKLTVVGKVDPSKIREKLEQKTKKKVDLISPQPKKDNNKDNDNKENNNNKEPKKEEKKPDDKKKAENEKKPKQAPETTAVLKVTLHCQGCIDKIRRTVTKTKGVKEMSMDKQKDLVTVKGTMDVKALTQNLKEKLKKPVEIVPPKKEEKKDGNGGDEHNGGNSNGGGGGKKKKGGGNSGQGEEETGGGPKMEGNKIEYVMQPGFAFGYGYGYENPTYPVHLHAPYPVHLPAPQMFSDENPNACSVM